MGMYKLKKGRLTKSKLVFLCTVCALAAVSIFKMSGPLIQTNTDVGISRKVIVDAGHGGVDSGAVGVNGEFEKDINLKIALHLKEILEFAGFEVIMIRDTDISLHDASADTISRKKVSDLKKRLDIINSNPDAIAVSIHQNKFSEDTSSGAQMFYGVLNPKSPALATSIQDAIVQNIQPENKRSIKKGTKSVYLLMKASIPMVLVECGFLSNAEEAAKLSTEEYQKEMAFAIFSGLTAYIENPQGENSGSDQSIASSAKP